MLGWTIVTWSWTHPVLWHSITLSTNNCQIIFEMSSFPKIWWESQNSVKDHVTRTAPSSRVECYPLHMDNQCTKSVPSFSTSSVSMYSLTTDHMFHFIINIITAHFVSCLTVQFHLPPSRYNHWPNQHQITISTNQKHMNALFLVMTELQSSWIKGC